MYLLDGTLFSFMANSHKEAMKGLLPELVKRLILNCCSNIKNIRMPGCNDVWAPGFDGVVENDLEFKYVCSGTSVWEFGTSNDLMKKINDDYEKRTANSLGLDKKSTEFYLVIPKNWAYKKARSEWENERKEDWKNVHVYDAAVLADWMNSDPATYAWFLESIGYEKNLNFSGLSYAWKVFSSKTHPAFSKSLFLNGREDEKKVLLNHTDKMITKVRAETTYDALGFCFTSLLETTNTSESIVVINNLKTYEELSRFCVGKTFLLTFKFDGDVIDGNNVILCYNKEDTSIKADVELFPLTKSQFDNAIKEMGISDNYLGNLYEQTHGNLLSLIRKIPGNSIESRPKWAEQDHIDLLAPMLILQNYDTNCESDKKIISFLANEEYDTVFERYNHWSKLEDAPIKFVNNYFILVNFEEAWEVLKLSVSSPFFDRYITVLNKIINFNGSLFDDGLVDYSSKRHLHNIFLSLVYFSGIKDNTDKFYISIKNTLFAKQISELTLENLSVVAEAAPSLVMDFIQTDFDSKNGIIKELFNDVSYTTKYCNILNALDELVLHEETRIKACDLLFSLYLKTADLNYRVSNSPKESLLCALCLWNNHTILSIDEKVMLIKKYLSTNQEKVFQLIIDLVLKQNLFFAIRNHTKTTPKNEVLLVDLIKATDIIAGILFEYCEKEHKVENLKKLLSGYHHFSPEILKKTADSFPASEYKIEDLVSLNYEIREHKYYASRNENVKHFEASLNQWIVVTTPSDEIGCVGWMFVSYDCPMINNCEERDFELERIVNDETRTRVLNDMISRNSLSIIKEFAHISNDEYAWGSFYSGFLSGKSFLEFATKMCDCNKREILRGLLNSANLDDCIEYLNSIDLDSQCKVLSVLNRKDVLDWIDTAEKERAYWTYKTLREFNENDYQKLIQYYPVGLLPYFAYLSKTPVYLEIDKIIKTLSAVIDYEKNNRKQAEKEKYELDKIVNKIEQSNYYSDEWADICIRIYDLGLLTNYPETLKKYYFYNPYALCKKIKNHESNAYAQFSFFYTLPECAYENYDLFLFFVDSIIKMHSDDNLLFQILGNILGRSHDGADGIFPHEYVREVMEKYNDLCREILIGKLNSFGMRFVGDGSNEKITAEKYKKDASLFDITYPQTAQLLRQIGEHFMYDGKRDQLTSEIGWDFV